MELNNNIKNNLYAPGIATYGAKGGQGQRGLQGFSIYYIPNNIDDSNIASINEDILLNRQFSNNYTGYDDILIDRKYQEGDIYLTPNGKMYKHHIIGNDISLYGIGELTKTDTNLFNTDDNNEIIYLKDNSKLCIGGRDEQTMDKYKALLNIMSDTSNGDYISFYNNINDKSMTISDTSEGFYLNSDSLLINNLYVENDDNNEVYKEVDKTYFYKPLTKKDFNITIDASSDEKMITLEDNIPYLCVIYNVSDGKLDISVKSLNSADEYINISTNTSMIALSSLNSFVSQIIYSNADDTNISKISITRKNEQN